MAISSGRCRIPVMRHPKEFFDIGRPFWYTPLSDKSIEMLLVPMECEDVEDEIGWNINACKRHCVLFEFCNTSTENIEENTDPVSGEKTIQQIESDLQETHQKRFSLESDRFSISQVKNQSW